MLPRTFVRTAVLVPWAIPTIVSAKMWAWMMNDQFGVINHVLLSLHLMVKVKSPKSAGVPDIVPLLLFRFRPSGR